MNCTELEARFKEAVQHFWNTRESQQRKQGETGRTDAGTRGAVTGGAQMAEIEQLVVDILKQTGLQQLQIRTKKELELPGYYRPEKRWDLSRRHNLSTICG